MGLFSMGFWGLEYLNDIIEGSDIDLLTLEWKPVNAVSDLLPLLILLFLLLGIAFLIVIVLVIVIFIFLQLVSSHSRLTLCGPLGFLSLARL